MKKTIKIRIISLIISLSIILSMLPISALAVVDGVAVIGGNGYDTLQAAFNAVTDGQTIKLLSNIYITNTVTVNEAEGNGKNFTLDLNGYTIDSGNKSAISHNGYGKMTIADSSGSKNGKITSSNGDTAYANIGTIRFVGKGSIIMTGGTVENTGQNGTAIYYGVAQYNEVNGDIEILGGTLKSTDTGGIAIYISSSSNLIVSGAKVQSKGQTIINNGVGKISIINNAEIISENSTTISTFGSSYGTEYTALEINSGVVKSTSADSGAINTNGSEKIVISGSAKVMSNITQGGSATISLSAGSVLEINGGTVEDTGTGKAIYSFGSAKITVSGNAFISSSSNFGGGTIDLSLSYGSILKITDGVVENTSLYGGAAIYTRDGSAVVEILGGTVQSKAGYAIYRENHFSSSTDGKALISNGGSVIKGGISAMYEAPILNDTEYYITGSKTDVNGEDASQLLKTDIQTDEQIRAYKYLKFEPAISVLTGTAIISNTAPRIGDVLSGSVKNSNNIGTLTFTWKANGAQVGTEKDYTVTVNELGKKISLEVKSSIETGVIKSDATEAVRKKSAPAAPEAPSVVSKTHNTVTLTANAAYEFSKDKSTWQLNNVFSGLNERTTYTFYQRIASTSDTEESEASVGFSETTGTAPEVPPIDSNNDSDNSNNNSGSSLNNNNIIIVIPPTPDNPNSPTQGQINVVATVDDKGKAIVDISNKMVIDAFEKALDNAKKNGNEKNGITVVLRVDTEDKNVDDIKVNLPKSVQNIIIENKIVSTIVIVDNPDIRIGMDLMTIKEINQQAKADVNITAKRIDNSKLSDEAKKTIGSRPLFDLKVNYGSDKELQNFGTGRVSISIPYTLALNENAENIKAVYVDENKKVQWIENSVYDSVKKLLNFNTNHFSIYGIGYKETDIAFTDIANHWAKEDVEFVVNRGLFGGTSTATFSPDIKMTRGMFVTVLGRMANADVSDYLDSSFSDVESDVYYMGYIEWASKNNIVNGVGNNNFASEQSVTREQMAAIICKYAKMIGYTLPRLHAKNIFADNTKISDYAKDAIMQLQMAGIIDGKSGNIFDPQASATRAEVSAILRRFIELYNER